MAMWNDYEKIARGFDRIANAFERIADALESDRKTENSSEKPNNCDTCRNKGFEGCEQPCLGCGCCDLYEPKDEPQKCSVNGRPYSECGSCEHFKCTADEPQTERSSE